MRTTNAAWGRMTVTWLFLAAWLLLSARDGDDLIRSDGDQLQRTVKPNIVLVFSDDQRYNTIRALGGKEVLTPNLDSLVSVGTTFTHAYNMGGWHGAICVASRTMMLTGLSLWRAQRSERKLDDIAASSGLWVQHLRKAGYDTYMTGKWHVRIPVNDVFDHVVHERAGMPNQTPQGYNRPLSPQDTLWQPWDKKYEGFWKDGKHWSEVLADDAVAFIGQASRKEDPFFMYLAFNAPHDPRQAPKEFVDLYPLEDIGLPENYLDQYPFREEMGSGEKLRDEQLAPFPRTPYAVKKHIQEYYASITHMDAQIGKIFRALASSGKLDNTIIFFVSDHGLAVGHHGLMGKQSMFDHSVRVPLVVSGPGIPKGEKRDQQVYLQDIMATSYDLSGITKPSHVYFNSLLPLIRNKNQSGAYEEIYGAYMNAQRMVRTDRHKLIVYPAAEKILLFDLVKDPHEKNDVSGDPAYRKVAADMKERLLKQQGDLGDTLNLGKFLKDYSVKADREQHGALVRDSLPADNFIHLYGRPSNFLRLIAKKKDISVAFLGGSITAGKGWRDLVTQYLEREHPKTKWTFLNAGIPSLGSLPHAFRFQSDVLAHGKVDLLFIESAVNDLANGTPASHQMRALEGIVRHARGTNRDMDIVLMAFADEPKLSDYAAGKIPVEVNVHEQVARHYELPFLNLSEEVFKRIEAGEFTWKDDFVDLHPSPFGHQLYFRTIRRMFDLSAPGKGPSRSRSYKLPSPIDASNYSQGRYAPVHAAEEMRGFRVDPSWKPTDEARTRPRFSDIPMLVSDQPGSSFEFSFEGNAVGIAIVSGPDAGIIQYSIDGGREQKRDLFTQWSKSLHLPWYLVLGDELDKGKHTLRVTLLEEHHPKATASACRIVYFLVNGPSTSAETGDNER